MTTERIRAVLAELGKELQRAEDIDPDIARSLRELHRHVDELERSGEPSTESMLDHVKELESRFAAKHPVLEQTARELVDAIAKMGI
jgi:hypothetical protein